MGLVRWCHMPHLHPCKQRPQVSLPNKEIIEATLQGNLPLHTLPHHPTKAFVLPHLTNSSLLSVDQLCDNNCTIIFTKKAMHIYQNAKQMLAGKRNLSDGLWDIVLPATQDKSYHHHSTINLNANTNAIVQKKNQNLTWQIICMHVLLVRPFLPFKKQ